MLVVLYIVVVVLGWMVFRVRAEDFGKEESESLDSDDLDSDDLDTRD